MKRTIREKLYSTIPIERVREIPLVEALSIVIADTLEQPEWYDEEGRAQKSYSIGCLVVHRDRLIRQQNTLQGRPS